jgi:hypothetical protein
VLCSGGETFGVDVTADIVFVVVAVNLRLQALDGMPQRFWHDDQKRHSSG